MIMTVIYFAGRSKKPSLSGLKLENDKTEVRLLIPSNALETPSDVHFICLKRLILQQPVARSMVSANHWFILFYSV